VQGCYFKAYFLHYTFMLVRVQVPYFSLEYPCF